MIVIHVGTGVFEDVTITHVDEHVTEPAIICCHYLDGKLVAANLYFRDVHIFVFLAAILVRFFILNRTRHVLQLDDAEQEEFDCAPGTNPKHTKFPTVVTAILGLAIFVFYVPFDVRQ